jgi:hypothetical protein
MQNTLPSIYDLLFYLITSPQGSEGSNGNNNNRKGEEKIGKVCSLWLLPLYFLVSFYVTLVD